MANEVRAAPEASSEAIARLVYSTVMQRFSSPDLEDAVRRSILARHGDSIAPSVGSSGASATAPGASAPTLSIESVAASEFDGGFSSPRILRLNVEFSIGDQPRRTESFVQKYSRRAEREAMVLLTPMVDQLLLPRLLGWGEDAFGSWLLMPYLDGVVREDFTLPRDVIRTLAHVHTRFEGKQTLLESLPNLDGDFLARVLDRVRVALEKGPRAESSRDGSMLIEGLARLREAPQILAAAQSLPQTLLHGDVHPGNIMQRRAEHDWVLFDWGNAMVGPAGVDLGNCIGSVDAPGWREYWSIVGGLTGEPLDAERQAAQFSFGKVFISIHYLPFAIEHLHEANAERMMREALEHCAALDAFV